MTWRERARDERPQRFEVADYQALGARLDQHVADGGRLDRAGELRKDSSRELEALDQCRVPLAIPPVRSRWSSLVVELVVDRVENRWPFRWST